MTVEQQNASAATAREKAQEKDKVNEGAVEEMRELEEGDPPTDLNDWPSGPAKYLTYGSEDDEKYGVGVTAKLGPANLERFTYGSIAIDGDKVDNPDDYKGEPLEGRPTDPQRPPTPTRADGRVQQPAPVPTGIRPRRLAARRSAAARG